MARHRVRKTPVTRKRLDIVPAPRTRSARFVVLTGLSGAGKSQAMRALEDLGYFCIDNLPTTLIPRLADLTLAARRGIAKTAVVVDVRDRLFLSQFPRVFRTLRAQRRLHTVLIFLEASDVALVRRFSETRRPHPLAADRSIVEGIVEERARLNPIKRMADQILDTSDLTVHELRQAFMAVVRGSSGSIGAGDTHRDGAHVRFQARDSGRIRSRVRRPLPAESAFRAQDSVT